MIEAAPGRQGGTRKHTGQSSTEEQCRQAGCSAGGMQPDSGLLTAELQGWREFAPARSRWYLDTVAALTLGA